MELKDLEKMTVLQLRQEASKFEDVKGVSGMKKQQLIDLLCGKLDIHAPERKIVGADKAKLRARIRELKAQRATALTRHDHEELAKLRKRIRIYKRSIRKHTVASA
ncbi:MAG: Rho termination factor N-terminal domain-containing protein [Acidobacteriota bacterium]